MKAPRLSTALVTAIVAEIFVVNNQIQVAGLIHVSAAAFALGAGNSLPCSVPEAPSASSVALLDVLNADDVAPDILSKLRVYWIGDPLESDAQSGSG